jgi:SAM-dependent methyltransferase
MDAKTHWSNIYQTKSNVQVSWYQPRPDVSLDLIRRTGLNAAAQIIDVGAGASTLADYLLEDGYQQITLLDISSEALDVTRTRLGAQAEPITWLEGDVTSLALPEKGFDLWHDRAVFHFLTNPVQRALYIQQVLRSVKVGGYVIVGTFALDGPSQCSGLDVAQYDADSLHATFGDDFERIEFAEETHHTPWGSKQPFVYCCCRTRTSI